jgi:6-phosphogluconolactonase
MLSRRYAVVVLLAALCFHSSAVGAAGQRVYAGTYTGRESKGIYVLDLDLATGKLANLRLAAEIKNPSFLAFHPNGRFLYACGEVGAFPGGKGGAVSAFAIDQATGTLRLLNQKSSRGRGPCHVSVDKTGRCALVANYGGGSVACLPIRGDGRLADATSFRQHTGSSVNPQRQKGPHAHSVNLDPGNRFAFVADLGLDRILVYRFNATDGTLVPNDPPWAAVAPGAGPRHFSFHPTGRFAYVINELNATVTAFRYDGARGVLSPIQTVPTLPEGFTGDNKTAEVLVHPSGRFLYGSNRGHDSIAAFAIDTTSGKLTPLGQTPAGGKWPRNFGIDPSGRYLIVANRHTNSLVVFRIDQTTGALGSTGHSAKVPAAVCVRFPPPAGGK